MHKTERTGVVRLFCQLGCIFPIAVMLLVSVDLVHGILKASERLLDYFGQTRDVSDKVGHLVPAVLQFHDISSLHQSNNHFMVFALKPITSIPIHSIPSDD